MGAHYITKEELVQALVAHHEGHSELLADCATRIGCGLFDYLRGKGFDLWEKDHVCQECAYIILIKAKRFDMERTDGNPFAYFTTVCLNHLQQVARGESSQRKHLASYATHRRSTEGDKGRRVLYWKPRGDKD